MGDYKDLQNNKVETKLSQLGALVSLATDEVTDAEQKLSDTKALLEKIQQEIEQLYMTLNEPFLYVID